MVYAADNASFIDLRDLLVNGEVKETIEAFGLGIGSRDIFERECHPLSDGKACMSGDEVIDSSLAGALSFHSCTSQSDLKPGDSTTETPARYLTSTVPYHRHFPPAM